MISFRTFHQCLSWQNMNYLNFHNIFNNGLIWKSNQDKDNGINGSQGFQKVWTKKKLKCMDWWMEEWYVDRWLISLNRRDLKEPWELIFWWPLQTVSIWVLLRWLAHTWAWRRWRQAVRVTEYGGAAGCSAFYTILRSSSEQLCWLRASLSSLHQQHLCGNVIPAFGLWGLVHRCYHLVEFSWLVCVHAYDFFLFSMLRTHQLGCIISPHFKKSHPRWKFVIIM
jgi:hypothetical protein